MQPVAPQFLSGLRAATTEAHSALEELTESHRLLDGDIDLSRYARLLYSHLSLHRLVSEEVAATQLNHPEFSALDWPACPRIQALESDIRLLEKPALPKTNKEAYLGRSIQTLGLIYVVEGSCMGNQRLYAVLSQVEAFQNWQADEFLKICCHAFSDRWKELLRLMTELVPDQQAELEAGAIRGFAHFRRAFIGSAKL